MIDNERENIVLYLSDDAVLEWFGRTIKTRKKVSSFLKHDMQFTRHDFVSVQNIDRIQSRSERVRRNDSPQISGAKTERTCKSKILRSNSPEWAEGCQPPTDGECTEIKKNRFNDVQPQDLNSHHDKISERKGLKRSFNDEDCADLHSKGDGILGKRVRRKCMPVTPPNIEMGQGDCAPSTSGTNSDRSHNALNAQLTKLYVECNGFIQFTRTRNSHTNDAMKWERKCKTQISFSEDPLNIGEYVIWAIYYTDESKCRRNLLSAFEEVAKEEEVKKYAN
ncbi:hypothetical protein evm_013214 [Chilo suppressalis]|nr:hypothetical protein evm_013214 [Chilo suppressalis]